MTGKGKCQAMMKSAIWLKRFRGLVWPGVKVCAFTEQSEMGERILEEIK